MAKKLIMFTIRNSTKQDYKKIHDKIVSVTETQSRIDKTLYLTITNQSSVNLREIIKDVNTSGKINKIFISEWEHPSAWTGLGKDVSDWMKNN